MKLASLRTGLHLTLNDVPFVVNRILEGNEFFLERKTDFALVKRSKNDLMKALIEGDLIIHGKQVKETQQEQNTNVDINGLPEEQRFVVMRKYLYINAAKAHLGDKPVKNHLDRVIEKVKRELDDENPPSVNSVYRWWKTWRDNDCDIQVLRNKHPGAKGLRKFKGQVFKEFENVIEEIYLTHQRHSKQQAFDVLVTRLTTLNIARRSPLRIPSRTSFYRMLESLDKYEIMAAREGKRVADKVFRATGKGVSPKNILERVEVDHTPMDVHVINPQTGLADGRPYLTLLLDRYSRMPIGFEIGFEPPSEVSVMRALRNAILPKNNINETFEEIKNEWPSYGIPTMLICDNGLEFHSHQLRRMCWELNIDLQFCPKGKPEYKGAVERFLGTLNRDVCHRLPGTTFSNIRHRGDYDSEKEARITLDDLKENWQY